MSACETWDVLQIARDARLCGRMAECDALLAEAAPDFEIGRCTVRRPCPKFILDEYADEYEDREPIADQIIAARRRIDSQDWLAWYTPLKTSSFDAMLREMYSAEAVAVSAMRPGPSFASLRKADSDAIEVRISSYVNIIRPQWYAVIKDLP